MPRTCGYGTRIIVVEQVYKACICLLKFARKEALLELRVTPAATAVVYGINSDKLLLYLPILPS